MYTPLLHIKVGFKGVKIIEVCFRDVTHNLLILATLTHFDSCLASIKIPAPVLTYFISYTQCTTWEKGSYAIYQQRRPRSACASVQSDLNILYLSISITVSIDPLSWHQRPSSACENGHKLHKGPFVLCAPYVSFVSHIFVQNYQMCKILAWYSIKMGA